MSKILLSVLGVVIVVVGYVVAISLFLPIEDQLEKADAIVVVSGGDTRGRTLHAVDLYHNDWAPELIVSGAAADPNSNSNAKAMLAIAASQGVDPQDIELEEFSRDTKENALHTKLIAGNYKKIILVTSDYHQRRVFSEFKKAYGSSTEFINSPAKDKNWGRKSWFLTPYGWWISVTEPIKLLLSRTM